MNIRETIQAKLAEVVAKNSPIPFPDTIGDDELLDTYGLDSAAFMTLLAEIESQVGYIPSAILEGDLYPETFGELVAAYNE